MELLAVNLLFDIPVFDRLNFGEAIVGQTLGFDLEIIGEHPVAGRFQLSRLPKGSL